MIIILVMMLHLGFSASISDDRDPFIVNVTMKNYQSSRGDQIVFIQYKLPDEELMIVGYRPLVTMAITHHMDTFACETLYSEEPFWNDGEPCGAGEQMLLHGWDRDALPFYFPEGVGIAAGKKTPYKYVVVNIHYLTIVKNDYSGNQLIISQKRRKYHAGVVLAGTNFISLSPKTHTIKTPFSCQYNGSKLSIFAAGVHAHRWARVISLYRVREGNITLILKGDPQQTHQSYLLPSPAEILDGDYLIGQCVYDNNDDREIIVGPTHDSEMCNVMVGYSYEPTNDKQANTTVPLKFCWNNQIPNLVALIPTDSEVPPKKTSDMYGTDHSEHAMAISTDLLNHTNRKGINFDGKSFYSSLIIVMFFGIAFFLAVTIWNLMRMKALRVPDRLNRFFEKETHPGPSRCWIFDGCFKRGDGFERVDQSSDGENELENNEV